MTDHQAQDGPWMTDQQPQDLHLPYAGPAARNPGSDDQPWEEDEDVDTGQGTGAAGVHAQHHRSPRRRQRPAAAEPRHLRSRPGPAHDRSAGPAAASERPALSPLTPLRDPDWLCPDRPGVPAAAAPGARPGSSVHTDPRGPVPARTAAGAATSRR